MTEDQAFQEWWGANSKVYTDTGDIASGAFSAGVKWERGRRMDEKYTTRVIIVESNDMRGLQEKINALASKSFYPTMAGPMPVTDALGHRSYACMVQWTGSAGDAAEGEAVVQAWREQEERPKKFQVGGWSDLETAHRAQPSPPAPVAIGSAVRFVHTDGEEYKAMAEDLASYMFASGDRDPLRLGSDERRYVVVEENEDGTFAPVTIMKSEEREPFTAIEGMDREQKADMYVRLSGKSLHASDCATSLAPAEEPGPCDCDMPAALTKDEEDATVAAHEAVCKHPTDKCFYESGVEKDGEHWESYYCAGGNRYLTPAERFEVQERPDWVTWRTDGDGLETTTAEDY